MGCDQSLSNPAVKGVGDRYLSGPLITHVLQIQPFEVKTAPEFFENQQLELGRTLGSLWFNPLKCQHPLISSLCVPEVLRDLGSSWFNP